MPAKLPYIFSVPVLIGLLGCAPCKDADILAAAAVAELAQSRNVRPSELTVEKVTFQNRLRAQVDMTHRLRDTRLPHNDAFSCEAARVAARKRGVVFGRRPGQRIKSDRYAPKVLKLVGEGQSYREISHRLGLSKNTVLEIVKRDRGRGKDAG